MTHTDVTEQDRESLKELARKYKTSQSSDDALALVAAWARVFKISKDADAYKRQHAKAS